MNQHPVVFDCVLQDFDFNPISAYLCRFFITSFFLSLLFYFIYFRKKLKPPKLSMLLVLIGFVVDLFQCVVVLSWYDGG